MGDAARQRTARGTLDIPYDTGVEANGATSGPTGSFDAAIRTESWLAKIARRSITIPLLVIASALWVVLGAVMVPVGVVIDLVRGKPFLIARFWAILATVLVGQLLGMFVLYAAWLATGFGLARGAFRRWNHKIMSGWSRVNVIAMAWIYQMRFDVEGDDLARGRATLLLSRHSSIIDTIVPIALLGWGQDIGFRIVLKYELLFSPPVDSIGHCRPVAFVKRGTGELAQELDNIRKLAGGLQTNETVLFFPEGTRFTPQKKAQVVAKLAVKNPEAAAAAEALRHVLPFRPAGTHALIDAAPHADLLFCAHTGFEDANQLEDFLRGSLYRKHVKVKYWRIAARDVPRDRAAREALLAEHWTKLDDWVAKNRA